MERGLDLPVYPTLSRDPLETPPTELRFYQRLLGELTVEKVLVLLMDIVGIEGTKARALAIYDHRHRTVGFGYHRMVEGRLVPLYSQTYSSREADAMHSLGLP